MYRAIICLGALWGLAGCQESTGMLDGGTAMPDGGTFTDLTLRAHEPYFPIDIGARHEWIDCSRCHHDVDNPREITCIDCHLHDPASTDSAHFAVGGYRYVSGDCLRCHYDATVPSPPPPAHLPFRIDWMAVHRPQRAACLECHPNLRSGYAFPAADFETFECLGCHFPSETDRAHRGMAGYAYESLTCAMSGCHPDGQ